MKKRIIIRRGNIFWICYILCLSSSTQVLWWSSFACELSRCRQNSDYTEERTVRPAVVRPRDRETRITGGCKKSHSLLDRSFIGICVKPHWMQTEGGVLICLPTKWKCTYMVPLLSVVVIQCGTWEGERMVFLFFCLSLSKDSQKFSL